MARAINSLPTPDSPEISTGMLEAAAFSAMRMTAAMLALLVMMSAKPSVPARLCLRRASSPSSALVLSALRRLTCSRSAPTGLTTKSTAPARIAETTLSMPPCAVCTITGTLMAAWRSRASTPSPSRFGMTRSRITQSIRAAVGAAEQRQRRIAVVEHDRLIAELVQHALQQPALHRIVIDDEDGHFFISLGGLARRALSRFGAISPRRLKGVLSLAARLCGLAGVVVLAQMRVRRTLNQMPRSQKASNRIASKRPPKRGTAGLGSLPEWNLADLYSGLDDPAIKRDLDRADAECVAFEEAYKGKLADMARCAGGRRGAGASGAAL